MKFKIDENLPVEVALLLKASGFDSITVLEQDLGGQPDFNIAQICQQEDRILVTIDLDFADIRAYPPSEFPGLIVLRLSRQDKFHVLDVCERLISVLDQEQIEQKLWIVEDHRLRIRS
jgi:predicted nuclease of predicted toxin-antitoxin system